VKVILVSEERLDELVEKFLANLLTRGPDSTRPELPIEYKKVVYYIHELKDAVKKGPVGL
jgi:hypothetical protein